MAVTNSSVRLCGENLQRLIGDVSAVLSEDTLCLNTLEVIEAQLELVYRDLACLDALRELSGSQVDALELCGYALDEIRSLTVTGHNGMNPHGMNPHYELIASAGRPRYDIPSEQVRFLLETKFTVPQISSLLGVSIRTIRRRMEEYSLSVRSFYSSLSDQELDDIVRSIQNQFGLCGNRQMSGHLSAKGIRVQQHRIRESQRRVDPSGCVLRRLTTIKRRHYCVNGPLALWHIDGNHKLIRYVL